LHKEHDIGDETSAEIERKERTARE